METTGIAISSGVVGAICGVVAAWIKARYGKTHIPQPLSTTHVGPFVTVGECKQHRCAIGERIRTEHEMLKDIMEKLDENDRRDEERAKATHARIDPLIEELGSVHGKMEYIEKAAIAATMGGSKK